VDFTDGQTRRYDLVIGADGLYSKLRAEVFPDAPKPRYSGQAVWRAVLPRPPEIVTATMWLGPRIKPGVNPVSRDEMYLFVTEPRPVNDHVDPATFVAICAAAGRLQRPGVADHPRADRRQGPHHLPSAGRPAAAASVAPGQGGAHRRRRACHHAAPGLGCLHRHRRRPGAGRGTGAPSQVPLALSAFEERRWERCRMVVENSARLGEIEVEGGDKDEHSRIMRESHAALALPI
jgi:hypothetical protein